MANNKKLNDKVFDAIFEQINIELHSVYSNLTDSIEQIKEDYNINVESEMHEFYHAIHGKLMKQTINELKKSL